MAFITYHRSDDVRTAADDKSRSGIHDGVCERAQIAARRTKVCFRPVWDVLRYCAFRSAVKDDDHDVNLARHVCDNAAGVFNVEQIVRNRIEGEGKDGDSSPFDVEIS